MSTERLGERIRKVFSPDFIRLHSGGGFAGVAPVFIVGLPRSGSTLIEQILASHGQVEATQGAARGWSAGAVHRSSAPSVVARTRKPSSIFRRRRSSSSGSATTAKHDVTDRDRRESTRMPNNFALIGLLQLAMPNARFINARRDPRDTCLSCYKQLFARGQSFTYDLMELGDYYLEYQRMMDHWHRVLPGAGTRRPLRGCRCRSSRRRPGACWSSAGWPGTMPGPKISHDRTRRAYRELGAGATTHLWRCRRLLGRVYEGELGPLIDVLRAGP